MSINREILLRVLQWSRFADVNVNTLKWNNSDNCRIVYSLRKNSFMVSLVLRYYETIFIFTIKQSENWMMRNKISGMT